MKRITIAALVVLGGVSVTKASPADCLFVADGEKMIDGPCDFTPLAPTIDVKKGSFQITAGDRFAIINIPANNVAEGYYNEFPGSRQPSGRLGTMKPNGACWENETSKVCVWKPGERTTKNLSIKNIVNQQRAQSTKPQFAVSAPQIWRDYYSNEVAADKKYMNAIFTVTGTVLGVKYGINNLIYAELNSSPMGDNIHAYFDKSGIWKAEGLKRGQEVSLTCLGAANVMNINLLGCR